MTMAHNNNGFNAMLETDHTLIREDLIDRIVRASARPCPQITEAKMMQHRTTGKRHSIFGMPLNYNREDYDLIVTGYVYRDSKSGVTYGNLYQTRELAETAHAERNDAAGLEFRKLLEDMTASELADQAAYWLR